MRVLLLILLEELFDHIVRELKIHHVVLVHVPQYPPDVGDLAQADQEGHQFVELSVRLVIVPGEDWYSILWMEEVSIG